MPTLPELARDHTDLGADDLAWLALLQADWQIIADLSFADLVLWLPDREGTGYWAAGQMRPTTGPTALVDDVVGTFVAAGRRSLLDAALRDGRIAREGDPEWRDDVPVRVEAIPVRRGSRIIALVARNTNLHGVRTPSRLELAYLQTASELTQMIAHGSFPYAGQRSDHADSPRVGDGFVRVDATGKVTYASPNAMSVYRKLGLTRDLTGEHLADVTRQLVPPELRLDEESITAVLGGRMPRDTEIGNRTGTVIVRSIPLRPTGEHTGGLILLRDVTDLRRRDRELVTKDATIREIHHRVKNNLQTVAALLRLQARRIGSASGREALEEAVRRVGAIAVVHETLSQTYEEEVEFDAVADQLLALVSEVGAQAGAVRLRRTGSFGTIGSDVATPLAMVLTEVLQNAMEHAFGEGSGGNVEVHATNTGGQLRVSVADDGVGLPAGFDLDASSSLGLSIVRTLVGELGGTLRILGRAEASEGQESGTLVELCLPTRSGA
ncbi:sensor histidine kinase [Nocardioides pocheonensis]|uniref:histidine kinase n=1 Tax=Nocardioides pocheonensis TaxID=661485 RepID=A0A3N0GRZ1_9ACTN|nr:histidine kinase N-terminal domain-containing protein [Nocardioides pocheonensis]RNM15253.1 ATPase [Nocardioides pocheonensis]